MPTGAKVAPPPKKKLVYDMGLSAKDKVRLPHDYDYSKHMRPMGKGFFKAATEPIASHSLYDVRTNDADSVKVGIMRMLTTVDM